VAGDEAGMNLEKEVGSITVEMDSFERFAESVGGLDGWLFRGQRQEAWPIESLVQRVARRNELDVDEYERHCFREFRRRAHSYFQFLPPADGTAEWLGWMQHFGAPTRLVDFTRSPWVAAFIAAEQADNDSAVWAVKRSRVEAPSDDRRDRNALLGFLIDPETWSKRRANGSETLPEPDDRDRQRIERIEPFLLHDRLAVQKGEFLFAYDLRRPFLEILAEQLSSLADDVRKFVIPHKARKGIMQKLAQMNCDAVTLFPGADGFGRALQSWLPPAGR